MGGPDATADADCKIVQWPGAQQFPSYGLAIAGMPSGIACNLKNDWVVGGGVVPYECTEGCVSNGANSTTGQNGATIQAPPPKPFAVLGDDFLCLQAGGPDNQVCLPPMKCMWPASSRLYPGSFGRQAADIRIR